MIFYHLHAYRLGDDVVYCFGYYATEVEAIVRALQVEKLDSYIDEYEIVPMERV